MQRSTNLALEAIEFANWLPQFELAARRGGRELSRLRVLPREAEDTVSISQIMVVGKFLLARLENKYV